MKTLIGYKYIEKEGELSRGIPVYLEDLPRKSNSYIPMLVMILGLLLLIVVVKIFVV